MPRPTPTRLAFALAGSAGLGVMPASAALVQPGTYRLHNHPDSGSPLAWGLQLDELFDVTPGHDRFTFDFDADGAAMFLDYDGSSVTIHGTAVGGLEDGAGAYDPAWSSLVFVSLTYTQPVFAPGDDDLAVVAPDLTHVGAVSWLATGESIALFDYTGPGTYALRFGDEDDDLGHRGFAGLSGWGDLVHGTQQGHVIDSQWLFAGELVPGPAALAFFAAGLATGGRRRRR